MMSLGPRARSCVAASRLGGPDLDFVSFGEMFDSFTMVRNAAPETLILADGDHGYGNALNVQRTVRAYGRAGAAAVLIEDKITPRALTAGGKPCIPREEARMKIRAAVEAAKAKDMTVIALTGRGGGKMRERLGETDVHICVPHERTARIQEVHILVLHCLCDAVDLQLLGEQENT